MYTPTLECNGGDCSEETLKTDELGQLSSLPTPTRSGYTFKGWYTEDGEQATIATVFTEDTTLYARWEKKSSGSQDSDGTSSGGGGNGGAGLAIAGAAVAVGAVVVANEVITARAIAALPDSSLIRLYDNGAEKAFEPDVSGKNVLIRAEASTASVLTGSRSYLEQLSAQGYTQLTLAVKNGDKALYLYPVTRKVTVDIATLLANTPQDGTFTVTFG